MTEKQQPDDMQLKAEIDSIASRIDHIIQSVQQYFPIPEKPSETENHTDPDDPDDRHPSHHQSPEQEA